MLHASNLATRRCLKQVWGDRDPYIIHLNIALSMVVSLYFAVEKARVPAPWLQQESSQEPWEKLRTRNPPEPLQAAAEAGLSEVVPGQQQRGLAAHHHAGCL